MKQNNRKEVNNMWQKALQLNGGGGYSQNDTMVMIYDCGQENTDIGIFDNIFADN